MKPYIIENIRTPNKSYNINIDDVKKHLLIDDNENDENIRSCCIAAIEFIEDFISYKIIEREYKITYKKYIPVELKLPIYPITNISSISYILNNEEKHLKQSEYHLIGNRKIITAFSIIAHKIEIKITAGYENYIEIPAALRSAIKLKAIALFLGTDAYDKSINQLILPFKNIRL